MDNTEMHDDRWARIVWSHMIEPGDTKAHKLITTVGAPEALKFVLDAANSDELETWKARYTQSAGALRRFWDTCRQFGISTVIPGDIAWPRAALAKLGPEAPIILFTRGDQSLLRPRKMAGIVGARAATGYGEHIAMEMTEGLVQREWTIVSGAAYGIDGMAHRAALAAKGHTIAVLAGGVDRFYPSGHDTLLAKIAEAGLVISELPPGQPPTKWRFLQRNRIVAALSDVLVVVEAGWRSGSLNTAGHAKAIGTPVGAVPGPITSAASSGCHRLIRDFGAKLVTTAEEVSELG